MSDIKVTQEQVNEFLINSIVNTQTVFDKCTVVTVKLPNGFILTESSACVDKENYDFELGIKICMERIENKVWELLGFELQQKAYERGNEQPYTNLSFSQALEYLKQGKKIKRKHWGGFWFITKVIMDEDKSTFTGRTTLIMAYLKDGGYAPATPYQGDLLANDFEVVE